MARDLGLADRLRARGLTVVEVDGWKDRGDDTFFPTGSVNHHTAGPRTGNAPSLRVCINGREDLPGPLCHVLKARDQTCYVIAAGRANHAGKGGWAGQQGNSSVYGLECENAGTSDDPWSDADLAAMAKIHAAFLEGTIRRDPNKVCQHYEWTTRKIDAHDINGGRFRLAVATQLNRATTPPGPPPPAPQEDDNMPQLVKGDKDPTGQWWITDGITKRAVTGDGDTLVFLGFCKDPRGKDTSKPVDAIKVDQGFLDRIPTVT